MTPSWTRTGAFFSDSDFDFEARLALGAAATGTGDVGLVLATLEKIVEGDPESWFTAWTASADSLAQRGQHALATGDRRTGAWALLAAAAAYGKALVVADGLPDQSVAEPTFRRHRRCWESVVESSDGAWVHADVPYQDRLLPGFLLRPDAAGLPRPTLVMTNGSDGALPGLLGYGAAEALARGWNAFLYDGPGQQTLLYAGIPFRHDWEAVLTPVLDALVARDDVDASALLGYGVSQAGYWVTRAIAFERRLRAAVVDPGVVDISVAWTSNLPQPLLELLHAGNREAFNQAMATIDENPEVARRFRFRARPYGITDPFDLFTEVEKYQVRDVAGGISTPLLILDPADEQFFPGQAEELHGLLSQTSDVLRFTRDEGANFHCQPLGRQLSNLQMLDWLEAHLTS
jgi:hypothetical protein